MLKINIWNALLFSLVHIILFSLQVQAQAQPDPSSTVELKTRCILVHNAGILANLSKKPASLDTNTIEMAKESEDIDCEKFGRHDEILTGAGDLVLVVDSEAIKPALNKSAECKDTFILYLNGVALSKDASCLQMERVYESYVLVRFRIKQGDEMQKLWSILYAEDAILTPTKLFATLVPRSNAGGTLSAVPIRSNVTAEVSLTTEFRFYSSLFIVLFSIVTIVWIGKKTDILRDAPDNLVPLWWKDAAKLKAQLSSLTTDDERDSYLVNEFGNSYNRARQATYKHLAKRALKGDPVSDSDILETKIGLALTSVSWTPVPATYSLSRTQMALWFTFTIATGAFLWMLYGDLRSIDGSVLTLLGISSGVAGLSWIVEQNSGARPTYSPSQGFFNDLTTGFDERRQVHRYQAVIVNIMFLFIGLHQVVQQLSFPVFDSTWLFFLGLSGAAYGGGKQTIEQRKE